MRDLIAHDVLADHRHKIVARQQAVYGPDAGIARLQHIVPHHAQRKPQASSADALDLADVRHKIFGYVDLQHLHDWPRVLRRRLFCRSFGGSFPQSWNRENKNRRSYKFLSFHTSSGYGIHRSARPCSDTRRARISLCVHPRAMHAVSVARNLAGRATIHLCPSSLFSQPGALR